MNKNRFTEEKKYPDEFGARVYKITRDPSGVRLTHMKITGGRLSVRSPIEYTPHGGEEEIEEKVRAHYGIGAEGQEAAEEPAQAAPADAEEVMDEEE